MSAIEKINEKEFVDMTSIENALWRLWTLGGQTFIAEQAAEELAALCAALKEAKAIISDARQYVSAMVGVASGARPTLGDIDAWIGEYGKQGETATQTP